MKQTTWKVHDLVAASDEYLTPSWVFDRLNITFDLDVCAPPGGVEWIPARRYFTVDDQGLSQQWEGRVWMNPPYSNSAMWVDRFMQHRDGIALIPHCRSNWHRLLWADADALADPNASTPTGRLFQFMKDGRLTNVYMPVVLAAYGDACVEAIGRVGPVRKLVI